jgi:hypothetical protein
MGWEDVRNAFEVAMFTDDGGLGHPCAGRWPRKRSCPEEVQVKRIMVSEAVGAVLPMSTRKCSSLVRPNLPGCASLTFRAAGPSPRAQTLERDHDITVARRTIAPAGHRRVVPSDGRTPKLSRHGRRGCPRRPPSPRRIATKARLPCGRNVHVPTHPPTLAFSV